MDIVDKHLQCEVANEALKVLRSRFERVKARKFAPLRLLRYRLILRKIRKIVHG